MPAGRPTKYDPKFCDIAIEGGKSGYSLTAIASDIGVVVSTVHLWMNEHEEFSDAVKLGRQHAVKFWEDINIQNARAGTGNATAAIFGLKNRAADEWRDISRVEATGKDGDPIKTETKLDVSNLTDAQLKALAAIKIEE